MNDMAGAIIPKSDQLNSDDLIAGSITITVTEVKIRGGQEQPVSIHYEGDNGKPYKSCKSMNRVLVAAWGPDASKYPGRRMTLFRDPSVKWAGMEVGGIRISHLSDIGSPMTMALTATKGSRKPFTVTPLPPVEPVQVRDWDKEIMAAPDLAGLQAVWKTIPASKKPVHEAAKDARKAELMKPPATQQPEQAPSPLTVADAKKRIEEQTDEELLILYVDSLPDELKADSEIGKAFKKRQDELKKK